MNRMFWVNWGVSTLLETATGILICNYRDLNVNA